MREDSISIAIIKGGKRGKCISVYARFDWFPELSPKFLADAPETDTEWARTVYYQVDKKGRIEIYRAKDAVEYRPKKIPAWHRGTFVDMHPHRKDKYRPLELLIPLKTIGLEMLPFKNRVNAKVRNGGPRWHMWQFKKTIFQLLNIPEYADALRFDGVLREALGLPSRTHRQKNTATPLATFRAYQRMLVRIKRHIHWIEKILEEASPTA